MKKTLFTLLIAISFSFTLSSQITIDGTMSDWDAVPILSEPGVYPYAKVLNDGANLNYLVNLGNTLTFKIDSWFTLDAYLDADNSSSTGHKSGWLYISAGNDYLLQGSDAKKYSGTEGVGDWSWTNVGSITKAFSADAHITEQKAIISELTGVTLSNVYTVAFPQYYSTNTNSQPDAYLPINDGNFAQRKGFTVKSRTELILGNTAEFTSENAYYHPFMKDANISDYIDFQSGAYSSDNPKHWASWALDLTTPGEFIFKMTTSSTGSGKAQLALIDRATNAIVKTFPEVWYPANASMNEETYANIDLSDVPAGKYMLKLTNPTAWDTFLKVQKITLTKTATSLNLIDSEKFNICNINNKLEINSLELMDVSIYNTTGQIISQKYQTKNARFDLANNIYIVIINQNGEVYSRKIVKP